MPHLPPLSPTNVVFLVTCLWATAFSGPLCILSGRYFMKTGRNVTGRIRPNRPGTLAPYGPHIPAWQRPKSDFTVDIRTGPEVRRHGRNILIFGILNLIIFVVAAIYFALTVTDLTMWGLVVLALIVEVPLAVYFGTTV